ncbi:HAD family hydrolase [Kurthia gibsonii]|uniref:HAD family hydrolase n=1 Tax=Kurthia gibsonii TaxID=33946 RepID=UPI001C3F8D40|nr:HAD family hydrolase [Kurthia gibsonii]
MEMENYIFDFDGTLADSEQCNMIATQYVFQHQGYKVPNAEQITYYMSVLIEKSFPLMIGETVDSTTLDELLTTFRSIYQQIEQDILHFFLNIEEVLQTLQEQKKRCFVLSSKKTDVLKRNLEILKVATFFEDTIVSDRVTHYKPDPAGIFQIQKEHTIQLEKTVMIGDAIFDLQMGKAAGVHTCAVTWG